MNRKLTEVIQFFGGTAELASALGVQRQAIYQWEIIPEHRAWQIECLSGGRFRAEELNPKIRRPKKAIAEDAAA